MCRYICHLCGRRTKQASNLRSHYKHFHKNNDISGRQIRSNSRIFNRFTQNEIDAQLQQTGDLMALLERGLQEFHREEQEKNTEIEKALEVIIAPKTVAATTPYVDKTAVNVKRENVGKFVTTDFESGSVPIVKSSPDLPWDFNMTELSHNSYFDSPKQESSNNVNDTMMTESMPLVINNCPLKIESVFIEDEMSPPPEIEHFAFEGVKEEANWDNDDNDWQNDDYNDAPSEQPFKILKCESIMVEEMKKTLKNEPPKCNQIKNKTLDTPNAKIKEKRDISDEIFDDDEIKLEPLLPKPKPAAPKYEMVLCKTCNRKYHDISKHWIENHSGIERPYECFICHKDYKRHEHLKYHMRTHGDERNYICHVCGDAFFLSNDLRKHIMNRHQVERPYKCTHQQCKKCFKNQHALNVHMRTHSGIKNFVCTVCSEAFAALSSLVSLIHWIIYNEIIR